VSLVKPQRSEMEMSTLREVEERLVLLYHSKNLDALGPKTMEGQN
jgi:hypothetical protein